MGAKTWEWLRARSLWGWLKANSTVMYYTLGSVVALLTICGILYTWDSNRRDKEATARQEQTIGTIHQKDSGMKAFMKSEMPMFVEQGVAPLKQTVDSLGQQVGSINTAVQVLSGKLEVIERMGLKSTALAKADSAKLAYRRIIY